MGAGSGTSVRRRGTQKNQHYHQKNVRIYVYFFPLSSIIPVMWTGPEPAKSIAPEPHRGSTAVLERKPLGDQKACATYKNKRKGIVYILIAFWWERRRNEMEDRDEESVSTYNGVNEPDQENRIEQVGGHFRTFRNRPRDDGG